MVTTTIHVESLEVKKSDFQGIFMEVNTHAEKMFPEPVQEDWRQLT